MDENFLYHCDSCAKDISSQLRISCFDCKEDLDLCVLCFASGFSSTQHLKSHSYIIKEPLDWQLFSQHWSAFEELLLVQGLKLFGIGNWDQISSHIQTKSKTDIDSHYKQIYVLSDNWPLPISTSQCDKSNRINNPIIPPRKPERAATSGPANHEIQGYMPGRDEFETEYDNEAETNIKDIQFEDTDTSADVVVKTTMLSIYNTVLDRRIMRKNFYKERGFMKDFRKILATEKKKTREEKEISNKTRVFCKMMSAADYDSFYSSLVREAQIRARIAHLQEYRRMGISTLAAGADYDAAKLQRSVQKSSRDPYSQLRRPVKPKLVTPFKKSPIHPLDISTSDGIHLLLPNEAQLCSALRILPRAYLVIKETLLRWYAQKGELSRRQARSMIKIDVNKTGQIYDLFVVNGWVKFAM